MKHLSVRNLGFILGVTCLVGVSACSDSSSSTGVTNSGTTGTTTSRPAASIQISAGSNQSGNTGTTLAVDPTVLVKDAHGNALAGVLVSFVVTQGGGSVQNATSLTDAQGLASAGHWTLGTGSGTNFVEATTGSLTPVRFVADAKAVVTTSPSSYNITIRYLATPTASQQIAVDNAVARWQQVITKDLTDIPMVAAVNACFEGQPAVNERIDDMLIYVEFVNIDGAGKVLGEAGPCFVRQENNLPVLGHLKLDTSDLALMERTGTMNDVIMHEMGHVLGLGTLWPDKNLLSGKGTADPRYVGPFALSAYKALGGLDADIAVENTGGDGTKEGHWRESVFGNELMTGYISGPTNPLSTMTISSLTDLGYGTNSTGASAYTLTRTSGGIVGIDLGAGEDVKLPKYKIDRTGKKADIQ